MFKSILGFYRNLNSLSIDVVAGAMCFASFLARLLNVKCDVSSVLLLGIAVWIIYTFDHLMDAQKMKVKAVTHRHLLHQVQGRHLYIAFVGAIVLECLLLFFNHEYLFSGSLFFVIVILLYTLVHRYVPFLKEMVISLVYACGVFIPTWVTFSGNWQSVPWIIIIQVALAALLNLLMFSWFDVRNDLHHSFISFTTRWGRSVAETCCWIVFSVCSLLTILSSIPVASVVVCLIAMVQVIPLVYKEYFEVNDRYRLLGDGAFMLPAIYHVF
jgi:4-hydroxybenzoate polyprenyltransferase